MHHTEEEVLKFINVNNLLAKNGLVVVGVSGGADSIALLSILHKNGYKCLAAHCNFHLRGAESDRDMNFVSNFCKRYSIDLEITHFDTISYSTEQHLSIEMAARELRYSWFSELIEKKKAQALAIAHHSDDVIETFFINLFRGAGLHGLTGIKAKNKHIVRPLLSVSRNDILEYLAFIGEPFVTDSSNNENDYLRNKIRNIIIPEIQNASPFVKQSILKSVRHLKASENFQNFNIEKWKEQCISENGNGVRIDLTPINNQECKNFILYELLRPFNASESIVNSIVDAGFSSSGQEFQTKGFILLKNRNFIEVQKEQNKADHNEFFLIKDLNSFIEHPVSIQFELLKKGEFSINRSKNHCYLDFKKLSFPLKIRRWKDGDCFVPFGMKNKKKLSDFFINEKMSLIEKENCYILENGNGDIIWIIGRRTDDRYKIDKHTTETVHLII